MLATHYDFVIGGDPDRDTMDLAVLDTTTGGVTATVTDTADGDGYTRMLEWAQTHARGRRVWALEGTGSFAAGFVAVLAGAGEDVVEITGGKRRRGAKNDRIDAIQAARTALSSEHQATPRSRGLREALRQVMATRRAVLVSRTKAINELKSLIVVAREYLRAPLRGRSLLVQLRRIEELVSPPEAGVEHRITVFTMRSIAARIRFLFAQTQPVLDEVPQVVVVGQFARSRPGSPGEGFAVRAERPVAAGAADVASDLPADRRRAAIQLRRDRALGVAGGEQVTDEDPFLLGQVPR